MITLRDLILEVLTIAKVRDLDEQQVADLIINEMSVAGFAVYEPTESGAFGLLVRQQRAIAEMAGGMLQTVGLLKDHGDFFFRLAEGLTAMAANMVQIEDRLRRQYPDLDTES